MSTARLLALPCSVLSCLALLAAAPAAQNVTRVSLSSGNSEANALSSDALISGDGRYVLFDSDATNLVAGDVNGFRDVFLRDRTLGTTTLVSVSSGGVQGNALSSIANPSSISADGRYVVFYSSASNLVAGDTNLVRDAFWRDLQTGTTVRVSVNSSGVQGNDLSSEPTISADGRYVAFYSSANNLVAGDTNGFRDCFVRDTVAGTTTRVSVSTAGAQGNGLSSGAIISADGRYVTFYSDATNLVAGDTNAFRDVFVRDLQLNTTTRVSVSTGGVQGDKLSSNPEISSDGRYVVFYSDATNLVAGDTNLVRDVFVRDTVAGTTTRASVGTGGTQGDARSESPAISGDGRFVAFDSDATNLVSGDTNLVRDTFLRDTTAGTTVRINVSSACAQGDSNSADASLSNDGRSLAFGSYAGNLVASDTNLTEDVFVYESTAAAVFAGDGINADVIAPVSTIIGSTWSAPLTLGHTHGTSGPVLLKVRTTPVNGPNFHSPTGGRLTEVLIGGLQLATFSGSHNASTGGIAPQLIPANPSLLGVAWAAQYTVVGGGFADLSQAVFGTVSCQ